MVRMLESWQYSTTAHWCLYRFIFYWTLFILLFWGMISIIVRVSWPIFVLWFGHITGCSTVPLLNAIHSYSVTTNSTQKNWLYRIWISWMASASTARLHVSGFMTCMHKLWGKFIITTLSPKASWKVQHTYSFSYIKQICFKA